MSLDFFNSYSDTPLEDVSWASARSSGVGVWLKREDLVHSDCSGNKWYKLLENIRAFYCDDLEGIASFGGGFSNHLHALAHVGHLLSVPTVGFVRGNYSAELTPTLKDCKSLGMNLVFLDKSRWQERDTDKFALEFQQDFPRYVLIPEGGANTLAVKGCQLIGQSIDRQVSTMPIFPQPTKIFVACGTGATLAGLVSGLPKHRYEVTGISVLKGVDTLTSFVDQLLVNVGAEQVPSWKILFDYHCGGYAKVSKALLSFIDDFERQFPVLLDPVYTAKVLFAINAMIDQGLIKAGENVIAVHTGGIQGRRGFKHFDKMATF